MALECYLLYIWASSLHSALLLSIHFAVLFPVFAGTAGPGTAHSHSILSSALLAVDDFAHGAKEFLLGVGLLDQTQPIKNAEVLV